MCSPLYVYITSLYKYTWERERERAIVDADANFFVVFIVGCHQHLPYSQGKDGAIIQVDCD